MIINVYKLYIYIYIIYIYIINLVDTWRSWRKNRVAFGGPGGWSTSWFWKGEAPASGMGCLDGMAWRGPGWSWAQPDLRSVSFKTAKLNFSLLHGGVRQWNCKLVGFKKKMPPNGTIEPQFWFGDHQLTRWTVEWTSEYARNQNMTSAHIGTLTLKCAR